MSTLCVCYSKAFTGGLRKYLHYYMACVLSTPPTLSLLTIGFLFRKVGRQLRWGQLLFFCGTNITPEPELRLSPDSNIHSLVAVFPSKVPVRTLLCRRARGCRSHHLPCGEHPFICERQYVSHGGCFCQMGLSVSHVFLLREWNSCPTCTTKRRIIAATRITRSCCHCWRPAVSPTHGQSLLEKKKNAPESKPYGYFAEFPRCWVCLFLPPSHRFVSDWVYSGVFRDVYGEFMIQVNEEYLGFRGESTLLVI